MSPQDEQDKLAALESQFFNEEFETVSIPTWLIGVLCYTLPAAWLLPVGTQTGSILPALIFITLIGSAFFYYIRHMRVINSFVQQERPLLEVVKEHRARAEELKHSRVNVSDSETQLSETEQENWNALAELLGEDFTIQDTPEKKKRWWRRNK